MIWFIAFILCVQVLVIGCVGWLLLAILQDIYAEVLFLAHEKQDDVVTPLGTIPVTSSPSKAPIDFKDMARHQYVDFETIQADAMKDFQEKD